MWCALLSLSVYSAVFKFITPKRYWNLPLREQFSCFVPVFLRVTLLILYVWDRQCWFAILTIQTGHQIVQIWLLCIIHCGRHATDGTKSASLFAACWKPTWSTNLYYLSLSSSVSAAFTDQDSRFRSPLLNGFAFGSFCSFSVMW